MSETIGQRLFKIRAACGKGDRDPETLDDFAARVKRVTDVSYNPVTLSLLERGKRNWRVTDVQVFAQVDPLKRGRVWLAFGNANEENVAGDTTIQLSLQRLPKESSSQEGKDGKRTGT